jgi:uncharacterized protein
MGSAMRERKNDGRGIGPPPRSVGRPGLLEAALLLAAFYASALVPLAPEAGAERFASPGYHAALIGLDALRILLVLLVIVRTDGLAAFGLGRIRAADPAKALLAAVGAAAIAAAAGLAFRFLGLANPLMSGIARGTPLSFAPLIIASSMATGYAEELFFRAYLARRLEGTGMGAVGAAVVSSLLFGGAHGSQGIVGVVSTTLIGLWFALRWHDGRNIHEIAIGHGLYDAIVLAIVLYA